MAPLSFWIFLSIIFLAPFPTASASRIIGASLISYSNNNLTGPIPSSGQLTTFPASRQEKPFHAEKCGLGIGYCCGGIHYWYNNWSLCWKCLVSRQRGMVGEDKGHDHLKIQKNH
ncbi:hypothetical protein GOBAR_AA21292 [Gossypium barbadense]|uniref:Uncharacterized protein n=1 Tax=Gossypium barbadense TaxID=3634 RepID=A0A2P5X7R2_GOSBA|nr:hypothetical protein GOBAR_AA21292 [Gossypium barbadense]